MFLTLSSFNKNPRPADDKPKEGQKKVRSCFNEFNVSLLNPLIDLARAAVGT